MKKRYFLLILLIFLVGCKEQEADPVLEEPGNKGTFENLIGSNTAPVEMNISTEFGDMGYYALPKNFCWKATFEECAHVKAVDVFNNSFEEVSHALLDINSKITLSFMDSATISKELPTPDDLEIYIFNDDSTLTPLPSKKLDEYQYEFNVPSNPATHNIMFKAIYKTEIGGVTYYPFSITGK